MLSHTSSTWAPWYVIPADRKWFARIAVAGVIAQTLIDLDPTFPTIDDDTRNRAADATLAWARDRFDDLSTPQELAADVQWRAYDLP